MKQFPLSYYLYVILVALLYLLLTVLLPNWRLLSYALHAFKPQETALFFWYSLEAIWTSRSLFDFILTIISAVLVGANAVLIIDTINILGKAKKVTFSVGGASVISLIATGCASCGLSLFSVFGLTGAISILPFHGLEIHLLSIALLAASLWYMLTQLQKTKNCHTKSNRTLRNIVRK